MLCLYVIFDKKRKEKQFHLMIIFGILHPQHMCMIALYYENNNTFTQYKCLKIIDRTDFISLDVKHALILKNGVKISPHTL